MTEAELTRLERLAHAATPGPWIVHEKYQTFVTESGEEPRRHIINQEKRKCTRYTLGNCDTSFSWSQAVANAAYISAVHPVAILDLISDLRQAQANLKALESCFAAETRPYDE